MKKMMIVAAERFHTLVTVVVLFIWQLQLSSSVQITEVPPRPRGDIATTEGKDR